MAMATMIAMVLDAPGQPLRRVERPIPQPKAGEVLVQVVACGICRTDLHIIDGEVPAHFPIVPGHEIVGRVIALGPRPSGTLACGDWVGIAWLGHSCGTCPYCRSGRENLCDQPGFTGATHDGGFATHVIAEAAYCLPLPPALAMAEAAPLLCAGLIGWRALRRAGQADPIGIYGFGAAGHLVAPLAIGQGRRVLAFTRPGDTARQALARELGCAWAGSSETASPVALDAALIFASDGALVPKALQAVRKGGRVICAGIHMSDIPNFPYADLWGEREICSIANLTREDGLSFLPMAVASGLTSRITYFPLGDANRAIQAVRDGRIDGAALLRP